MANDPKAAVLASLASAADAAHQVYMTAMAANPGADLSALYLAQMNTAATLSDALVASFNDGPTVAPAQANLDALTTTIRAELSTIKNVSSWITLTSNLVQLAATVGQFFVAA